MGYQHFNKIKPVNSENNSLILVKIFWKGENMTVLVIFL